MTLCGPCQVQELGRIVGLGSRGDRNVWSEGPPWRKTLPRTVRTLVFFSITFSCRSVLKPPGTDTKPTPFGKPGGAVLVLSPSVRARAFSISFCHYLLLSQQSVPDHVYPRYPEDLAWTLERGSDRHKRVLFSWVVPGMFLVLMPGIKLGVSHKQAEWGKDSEASPHSDFLYSIVLWQDRVVLLAAGPELEIL